MKEFIHKIKKSDATQKLWDSYRVSGNNRPHLTCLLLSNSLLEERDIILGLNLNGAEREILLDSIHKIEFNGTCAECGEYIEHYQI